MQLESILYIAYSVTSITVSLVVALLFWNRRNVSGAKCMAIMMGAAALWGLCNFLSDLSTSNLYKLYWENISYFGIVTIPVAWLAFATQFTKHEGYLTRRKLILLFIIPSITVLLVWTNDLHHLVVSKIQFVKTGQMIILDPTFSIWFWVHAVYSYSLFLLGTLLLIKMLITLPKILRSQIIIMLTAILVPVAVNILYTFNVNPAYPIDPTIFSFTFTGFLCFIGMFQYRLFELIPLARNAVIEDMNGILIVLDNQNHIIDINAAAKDIFGIREKSFIGKSISDLLGQWASYFKKYENVMNAEEKISIDTKDGRRHFDLRIAPLFNSKKKVVGRSFILYDITVLEDAISNLEESHKSAESANKAKSQFLATMSHEIRTPLGGIIGMTELLASANHTEEEQGYLQTIQSCAASLLDIINDILDFSKIEAGKMVFEETDFNLENLITSTTKIFFHQSKETDITLLYSIDHDIPANLMGDPVRVKQILINLIGNALKFTEKGKVEVRVEQVKCEDQQVVLRFSVIDTGIGVPEDKIDNLFKRFEQVDSSTTRKYGGTGLGLAIVKHLVTLMGGDIDIESKLGEGSRFSFTIPFKISHDAGLKTASYPEIDFRNKNITVLLTEDSKVNQALISKLLEKKNIKVDIAGNGKVALQMLTEKNYDLILMDIQMPEMDGYETTIAIRKNEAGTAKHMPIIALTANATELDRDKCIKAGMDDYITKPIKTQRLYACLYKHTGGNDIAGFDKGF